MKKSVKRVVPMLALGAVVLFGANMAVTQAQDMSTGIPEADHRIKQMKTLGMNMKAIAGVAKGEAEYSPELNANAEGIRAVAMEMDTLFPEGSGGEKTRSKPEIWQNTAEFSKAIKDFQTEADKLVAAVATGDRGQIGAALGATGKTCGGCHKPFRKPNES
ncbi:c-type cytochrome [Sneathiella chinensis]|uniref:Cytochrome c n=1 Tax=Sneathiella chinensis TaxID=349750 RepID=A0ABQ5U780_9PROT|nr:cytochrome c [Sneathiella chinensis]GLQ07068.1 cytochrome c [Sneathiella chinensis]